MLNLSKISPYLLTTFSSESELIKNIDKLSHNFTTKREDLNDYLADEKMISAYTCFYLTTNYPKFSHVLLHLKQFADAFHEYEWIDVGCGPGTFLFAITDYYAGALKQNLWGIETSALMRKQAKKIADGLYPYSRIKIVQSPEDIPAKKTKRIVLFSHSLNEMGNEQALSYLNQLQPDKVLFIEPGTKEFFKQYLILRQKLISMGLNCLYPCPSNNQCPMAQQDDWCHQYIKVKHDPEISRLTQMAYKNRKWLPLTIGLFAKKDTDHTDCSNENARIVRTYPSTKFSFEWQSCHFEQKQNKLTYFQVLKRGMSKKFIKELEEVLAGSSLEFELDKMIDDHKWRVKIKK